LDNNHHRMLAEVLPPRIGEDAQVYKFRFFDKNFRVLDTTELVPRSVEIPDDEDV